MAAVRNGHNTGMQALSRQQLIVLVLLTLVWGFNWPIMKLGVTGYPPLTFRAISIALGTPVLGLALLLMKIPFRVARKDWPALLGLAVTNMFVWHALIILAVSSLSSGRAAILGYTMPIFSAVLGRMFFQEKLHLRAWTGVGCAALGVSLLLWHELTQLSGKPVGVVLALTAAASWALGTQQLRRTTLALPTLTISFWMTAATGLVMATLSLVFERTQWQAPTPSTWTSILYNAVMIFGFAHAAWFFLARGLPPVASTLSVMLIPILGVFSGALWLGEVVHWQDWAAVVLMMMAIGSVLLPTSKG
jgi:drug/metabolite transporter (DMT)-like permease